MLGVSVKKQPICIILIFTLISTTPAVHKKPGSFSSIRWTLGPLINVNRSDINRYYPYSGGFIFNTRTPFYFGAAELGVACHSYAEYESVEFIQLHCYLAFLYERMILKKILVYGGTTVGNTLFHFDAEDNQHLQNESELTLGLTGGLSLPISARFSTQVSVHYSKIFTYHPIEIVHAGLNLVYKMKMPEWLREFLE